MERRDFLKSAVAGGALAQGAGAKSAVPRRRYRDNIELSIIGFGGIVVVGQEQKDADREVAQAFERGVNYFDVAPSYGKNGEAEIKLGLALKPYRSKSFLACKTQERTAEGARRELEQSLKRLHTDHFDLYQFHAVTTMKDVDTILGPGGAAETFIKARQEGKVRYLGCSAHSEDAAIALMDRFQLDSVLFPVNFILFGHDFGPKLIAHAKKKGVARMALKAMAKTRVERGAPRKYPKCWYEPIDDPELARKAVRFTLSEDITAAEPPGDERLFRMALDFASEFKPLSKRERKELLASTASIKPIFPA